MYKTLVLVNNDTTLAAVKMNESDVLRQPGLSLPDNHSKYVCTVLSVLKLSCGEDRSLFSSVTVQGARHRQQTRGGPKTVIITATIIHSDNGSFIHAHFPG